MGKIGCLVLMAMWALALSSGAQQPNAPQTQATPEQRPANPDDRRVELGVVVTDKEGKPISGLKASDFEVLDNNQPIQVAGFHAYTTAEPRAVPDQVIMLIDAVNVDFEDLSRSRLGVDKFLRLNEGHLANPVSIVWLTDEGLNVQPGPSMDGNATAELFDATKAKLRSVGRYTGAQGDNERYQLSLANLERVVRALASKPGRKLLIWVGPGWPLLDRWNVTLNQQQQLFRRIVDISTLMRKGQIVLYSVSYGMPGADTFEYENYLKGVDQATQAHLPNLNLKTLAVQSGGLVIPPSNDLVSGIARCVDDATANYSVSFLTSRADRTDQYHQLKLHVDKPGLTVRTSAGYYDQPSR